MTAERPPSFDAEIVGLMVKLRARAIVLVRRADRADDLVQETIARALRSYATYQPGTNLMGWLCTIMRNAHIDQSKRAARFVQDHDGVHAATLVQPPEQEQRVLLGDVAREIDRLPEIQREALWMNVIEDVPHKEAARDCGTSVLAMKKRLFMAREHLRTFAEVSPS